MNFVKKKKFKLVAVDIFNPNIQDNSNNKNNICIECYNKLIFGRDRDRMNYYVDWKTT